MTIDETIQQALELVGRIDAVPKILGAVRHVTGMEFAAIVHVAAGRWIVCEGLGGDEAGIRPGDSVELDEMICADVGDTRRPVVIDCADSDPRYADHPARERAEFRSFLSFPIILADGSFFGTLCAFDAQSRVLAGTPVIETIGFFADLVSAQIDEAMRFSDTRRSLRDEKASAVLREQFIAVLGHDLRNPVAAVTSGARMLLRMPLNEQAQTIARLMQGSALRMNGLIDNLMDFAHGRLGDGIEMSRGRAVPLRPVLEQVIGEVRSISRHRIEMMLDFEDPVRCDPERIGQLVSNLVGNAVQHGAVEHPVTVRAWREDDRFLLSVANGGKPIPDETRPVLFTPFARGHGAGLGLGLYIASEIARGHGGGIDFVSTPEETRFTLDMPA